MTNIVSLRGGEILAPGTADPSVVEIAEQILEMARSGEIHGLTAILQHSDDALSCRRHGRVTYGLLGIMQTVLGDLTSRINAE